MRIESTQPLRYERMLDSANAIHSSPAENVSPLRSRRRQWICVIAWTALTVLALWWLFRANAGPSVWIVQEGDSSQPATTKKFRAWFRADVGLQRVYPWVLLGP